MQKSIESTAGRSLVITASLKKSLYFDDVQLINVYTEFGKRKGPKKKASGSF